MADDLSTLRESLAEKLRSSRMRLGMTQQQVSEFVGISRSAVSEIETSDREVSATELRAFSLLYGESLDRLLATPDASSAVDKLVMRASELNEVGRKNLRQFVQTCAEFQDLEEKLGTWRQSDVRAVEKPLQRLEDAELLAEQERRRIDLGVTPARQLLDVLEDAVGVKVVALEMDGAISGASVTDEHFGPAILLNSAQWPARQVFTLAHEYFHLLSHGRVAGARETLDGDAHVSFVAAGRDDKTRVEEFADHFAGHLLMPREHLVRCVQRLAGEDAGVNTLDLVGLARYFGVSVQALFRRLAVIGVISREAADAAYSDATLQDEILRVGGVPAPEPARMKRLAVRAHAQGLITKERLGQLLRVSTYEIDREIRRYGGGAGLVVKVELRRST